MSLRPHAPVLAFGEADGCLTVGGQNVQTLVEHHGTPLFLYERDFLDKRVSELRAALPKRISLHYAVKANPFVDVVSHMSGICDGLDVASKGELALALQTQTKVEDISFAGPGKRDDELKAAVEAGCLIVLESLNEARRLSIIAKSLGSRPRVALRLNPDFELKTAGMRMSGGPKPFGVDAEQAPEILSELAELNLDFQGLHIFTGSQNLKIDALIEAYENIFALVDRLLPHLPAALHWLNIGGGLGVPYFPGDEHLDLKQLGDRLSELLKGLSHAYDECEIVMELGRYLVAEAGVYICEIVDKKTSREEVFLVTDGGLHHQLAASGNFGQILRKNYPVAIANRLCQAELELVNIVGCLCTPLDRLADKVQLPKAEVGDLVAVFLAGAYGASASPQGFLGHGAAKEMLL